MNRLHIRPAAVLLLAYCLLPSCGGDDRPAAPAEPEHRAFLFAIRGVDPAEGRFVAVTSDPRVLALAEGQLALPAEQRNLHINGPVAAGNGGHNLDWSWHFAPGGWDLVEISVELCDGTPQHVEDDVEKWIADVGSYCPWGSYVERELP